MANLKASRSCLALGLTMTLIPQAAFAADYNPDGFHECTGERQRWRGQACRHSCATKSSWRSMSILDTIRQNNPTLRDNSDGQIKARIRNYPEFSTFSDAQFDRYVTGNYGEP